jgi:hypothetical protein
VGPAIEHPERLAGKSVLLAMLALQFRRYPGNRIFIFDKLSLITAAAPGTASLTNQGASCRSDCANGRMGNDNWHKPALPAVMLLS